MQFEISNVYCAFSQLDRLSSHCFRNYLRFQVVKRGKYENWKGLTHHPRLFLREFTVQFIEFIHGSKGFSYLC